MPAVPFLCMILIQIIWAGQECEHHEHRKRQPVTQRKRRRVNAEGMNPKFAHHEDNMKLPQMFGKGALLALSALFVTACNGNSIEGTLAGHEFGQIKTAFFDLEDLGEEGKVPIMIMVDVEWSCEEVNLLFASLDDSYPDEALFTDEVVGGVVFELAKMSEDGSDLLGSTDLTDYTVADLLGEAPAAGTHIAIGVALVGKVDANPEDEVSFLTKSGSLTLGKFDEGKGMAGDFEVTLQDEEGNTPTITGEFNLSYCNIELPSNTESRLQLASQSFHFPGARR